MCVCVVCVYVSFDIFEDAKIQKKSQTTRKSDKYLQRRAAKILPHGRRKYARCSGGTDRISRDTLRFLTRAAAMPSRRHKTSMLQPQ